VRALSAGAAGIFGGATLAVGLNWLGKVPVPWAIAVAMPVAGLLVLAVLLLGSHEPAWQPLPDAPDTLAETQASILADRFANARRQEHRYVSVLQPRLRRLALASLRNRAEFRDVSSVDDPRVRAVLGPELHAMLTDRTATLPAQKKLIELLDRLEET
jgi:hypothetical protein